tara:strand:- start:28 stop:219 length:192 start_codon:yes stop_codon:yes gene_type:complete
MLWTLRGIYSVLDDLTIPANTPKVAAFQRNGGNFGPEWVATFKRNGGSFAPEYAYEIGGSRDF